MLTFKTMFEPLTNIKTWVERCKKAAPKSDPENWPEAFKVLRMEAEIKELREAINTLISNRAPESDTYAVVNKEESIEFSASWPEACFDHIKYCQMIDDLKDNAKFWKVR